jgi:hypothetical protein
MALAFAFASALLDAPHAFSDNRSRAGFPLSSRSGPSLLALHHALAHSLALGWVRASLARGEFDRLFHFFFAFPALLRAMAIACFCGLPAFISALMLAEIVFLDDPFFSGILSPVDIS